MNAYTALSTARQQRLDSVENLLDEATELCPASEVFDLISRHKQREPREKVAARNAILFAHESGAIGAFEAIAYMEAHELFGDADFFLKAFAAGIRALSGEGRA